LYEQSTGSLVALIETDRMGQMRTGAVTGIAARLLANPGTDEVGLIGCGWQAESQLAAVATTCPIRRACVYSRDEDRRRTFAAKMTGELGIKVVAVAEPRRAVESLPIVITATTSRWPVFDGDWLSAGSLVCAVGSNWKQKAEIDATTARRAAVVICDSVECCRHEAGDFETAIAAGDFAWESARELSDVLVGTTAGRRDADDIILFKSVGMAIEDVAVGAKLVELARQRGIGSLLPI
jgi:ornithine cyclodeaminase/alanine dehydrogenase-like protein (mu-crystallin family)